MAIIENPPFIILKNPAFTYAGMTDPYKQINITEFDGFYKDIMLSLQDRMGFIPVVMLARPTTTFDELVEGVANGLFDTVMDTITINAQRNSIVHFSKPLLPSSIRVVIRMPTSVRLDLFFFIKPFSWQLWLLILGTIAYASLLLWYFEGQHGIVRSVSHVFHVVFNREQPPTKSKNAVQFLTFGLHVLYIILFAVYTANLLYFIIKQNSEPSISGIDDIKNGKVPPARVGILVGTSIENFYLKSISEGVKNYYPLKTIKQIYASLLNGDIDAALWSNQSTEYHVNNIYCNLMAVGVEFSHSSYQLPVPIDWLYKEDLDSSILSLIESDTLDRIAAVWLTKRTCSKEDTSDRQKQSITLESAGGLFITFLVFSIISIAVHFWPELNGFGQRIVARIRQGTPLIVQGQRPTDITRVENTLSV